LEHHDRHMSNGCPDDENAQHATSSTQIGS
jgi:hypothetical protein